MRCLLRHIISMLPCRTSALLGAVAGMFSARGYNIDSLTVAATHDPEVSRFILVTFGDDAVIAQTTRVAQVHRCWKSPT
ncbi:MAG: hypothetical protein IPF61_10480 [Xanthomonadales bacterium]|nr:hypothetical protein [Xanthomonadales bacterium]